MQQITQFNMNNNNKQISNTKLLADWNKLTKL